MNKKLLLSFALAAAMAGCINDADVPSGNGDNPISGAKGGNMEISFVVPNSSNGRRGAFAPDSCDVKAAVPLPPKTLESMKTVLPKNTK